MAVRRSKKSPAKSKKEDPPAQSIRMFLVPCSCGTTFAVTDDYDRKGTHIRSFLPCPTCGKRHDPKNRLLQMGFHPEGYWKVDDC